MRRHQGAKVKHFDVSNVIYHKFSHGAVSYALNGENVNVMLKFLNVVCCSRDWRFFWLKTITWYDPVLVSEWVNSGITSHHQRGHTETWVSELGYNVPPPTRSYGDGTSVWSLIRKLSFGVLIYSSTCIVYKDWHDTHEYSVHLSKLIPGDGLRIGKGKFNMYITV